tara:strand:- start:551 stop:748 length:198 start_codon:yes stop_codon:yes gene_type:complete
MEIINYKKHDIVLDAESYWNSKTLGGNVIAKIYKDDDCIFKTKYLFYKKNEIIKMLKEEIKERIK